MWSIKALRLENDEVVYVDTEVADIRMQVKKVAMSCRVVNIMAYTMKGVIFLSNNLELLQICEKMNIDCWLNVKDDVEM